MKKRFNKFCSLLLTFAVTATTVLSSEGMLLTTYADDTVEVVEYAAEDEVVVEATAEDVAIEEEAIPAEEVEAVEEVVEAVAEDAVAEEAVEEAADAKDDATPAITPGIYDVKLAISENKTSATVTAYVVYNTADVTDVIADSAISTNADDVKVELDKYESVSACKVTAVYNLSGTNSTGYVWVSEYNVGAFDKDARTAGYEYDEDKWDVSVPIIVEFVAGDLSANTENNDRGLVVSFAGEDMGWRTVKYNKNGSDALEVAAIAKEQGQYYYTGKAIKPTVVVYDGDEQLIAGKDYTLKYGKNNKEVAIGAVNLKGNFGETGWDATKGTKTEVAKAPYVEVVFKGTYKGKGKDNVTKTIRKYFDIIPAEYTYNEKEDTDLDYYRTFATVKAPSYVQTGKAIKPTVTIYGAEKWKYDKNGRNGKFAGYSSTTKLRATDYELYYVSANAAADAAWNKLDAAKGIPTAGEYFVAVSANHAVESVVKTDDNVTTTNNNFNKTGAAEDGQFTVYVYDKTKDLTKAKVKFNTNSVSWDAVSASDNNIKHLVEEIKIGNTSVSLDNIEAVWVDNVVTKKVPYVTIALNEKGIKEGYVGNCLYGAATKKLSKLAITGKDIELAKVAEGVTVDTKKKTYTVSYNVANGNTVTAAANTGSQAVNKWSVSADGVALTYIAPSDEDYDNLNTITDYTISIPKGCDDPVGKVKFEIKGNPSKGYNVKPSIKGTFVVEFAPGTKIDDVVRLDVNGSLDKYTPTSHVVPFKDYTATVSSDDAKYVSRKLMNPIFPVEFMNGNTVTNKYYTIKLDAKKADQSKIGTQTATITFKGVMKKLEGINGKPTAKINFTVVPSEIESYNFSNGKIDSSTRVQTSVLVDALDFKSTKTKLSPKDALKGAKVKVFENYYTTKYDAIGKAIKYTSKNVNLKAGVDYKVDDKVYTISYNGAEVSINAVTEVSANQVYYAKVVSANNAAYVVEGNILGNDEDAHYVPFSFAKALTKRDVITSKEDVTIYQKGDVSYLGEYDWEGRFVFNPKADLISVKIGDKTYKLYKDYELVPVVPKNMTFDEYYGSAGKKKITVKAHTGTDFVGSVTVTFTVKPRITNNDTYKGVLTK